MKTRPTIEGMRRDFEDAIEAFFHAPPPDTPTTAAEVYEGLSAFFAQEQEPTMARKCKGKKGGKGKK